MGNGKIGFKLIKILICLTMSFLTLTSTMSIAFILAYIVVLIFSKRVYRIKVAFIGIAVFLLCSVMLFNRILPVVSSFGAKFQNPIVQERLSLGTFNGRVINFVDNVDSIKVNPLGYGSGQVGMTNVYFSNNLPGTVDNGFLATAINLGLLGAVLLILFIYQGVTKSIVKYNKTNNIFYKYSTIIPLVIFIANISGEIFANKFITICAMAFFAIIYSRETIENPRLQPMHWLL